MTKRAATHQGHCQACDSVQMLPKGVLAKHGYTTRWGFFEGTCAGSGWRPFERAKDLIERVIESQREAAASLRNHAAEVRAATETGKMTVRVYVSDPWSRRGRSGYQWIEAEIKAVPHEPHPNVTREYWAVHATATVSGKEKTFVVERHTSDLNRTFGELREKYASHLEQQAGQRESYVEWQKGRIANWQEQPLIPRKRENGHVLGES